MIPFKTEEFIITGQKEIPLEICDKLWKYHITPMIWVREQIGIPIWASQKSGWRPKEYELSKGRSGNSEHVFRGKGAVDWTCENFQEHKDILLELMIEYTEYTRFAVYNSFIHVDFREVEKRTVFKSGSDSKWEFVRFIE